MIDADTFAFPALLALFAAVPICCVWVGMGRKGVVGSLILYISVATTNLITALNVNEFGEFGFFIVMLSAIVMLILLPIGWHVGEFLRERRTSPGKRHRLVGE